MPHTRTALLSGAVLLAALTACSDDGPPARSAAPSVAGPTTGGPPSASPATPGASSAPATPTVALQGAGLGVTRVGVPFREAVEALSGPLGPPTGDPAGDTGCVSAASEVDWGEFRVGELDSVLAGWVSTGPSLTTPSGVRVGTDRPTLERVYGDRLTVLPASPDAGPVFTIEGVELDAEQGRVVSLFNGVCSPP